ncbi:GntR family transcriptional regulator [Bifidobacterium simiarum]|uniref:GntR family transcriptional regulator n=1 Tax=Bifidobacterium simiarum TaxID=2045441 RepID=UPI001BDD0C6F|nr:GntR family transcriptional regulator [Bifidobacterium simiarum]MBT1167171.1 GntR family transcriptional regulator [Bifidobacterium simiarum]
MRFSTDNGVPLYLQVAEQIEVAILTGEFAEGTQVPSTTAISATYRINPATVLKGMNLLVDQGLLVKRRGLGMFVADGAQQRARGKGRMRFLGERVAEIAREAVTLGISLDDLTEAMARRYRQIAGTDDSADRTETPTSVPSASGRSTGRLSDGMDDSPTSVLFASVAQMQRSGRTGSSARNRTR